MHVPQRLYPPRHSIFWPLSTVLLGVFVMVLLLASPAPTPLAQNEDDPPADTPYPSDTPTVARTDTPYPAAEKTATARALTEVAGGRSDSTSTTAPTATDEPANNTNSAPAVVADAQPTWTSTATREPNTPTNTDEPEPRATNTPDNETPTITNTATNTPEANTLTCPSGETTMIEGIGPPNTPLILFFEERPIIGTVVPKQPVGGTTSDDTGFYSIPLKVRTGEIGEFLVRVETRDRNILVRELICNVPPPTPGL